MLLVQSVGQHRFPLQGILQGCEGVPAESCRRCEGKVGGCRREGAQLEIGPYKCTK